MVPALPREDRFLAKRKRLAVEKVEAALIANYPCRRLDFPEVHALQVAAGLTAVWKIHHGRLPTAPILFFGVDDAYPTTLPKLFLSPASEWFLRIPHVNQDGSLCLLIEQSTVDQQRPDLVAIELVESAVQLIGEGLAGTNRNDFITEAESYWQQTSKGTPFVAFDFLGPRSRIFKGIYSASTEQILFAETEKELRQRTDALGYKAGKLFEAADVPMVWSEDPLFPDRYPQTNAQLATLVKNCGCDQLPRLLMRAREKRSILPVVIAFQTHNGVAAFGASFNELSQAINGFRPQSITPTLLLGRIGALPCSRHPVRRADPKWLNWRGGASTAADEHSFDRIAQQRVLIVGCGSIGSDVAMLLAKSGVGFLTLVDHEVLTWDNVGRHLLGAAHVGSPKSAATARVIGKHLPHVEVGYEVARIEDLVRRRPGYLSGFDVTVCLTGDWKTESLLNSLQRRHGGKVIFGWVEAHGLAGHAILVNREGGCLGCGRDEGGNVRDQVISWQEEPLRQVPACGGSFTPHGALETSAIKASTADLTLETLLDPARPSEQRVWVGSPQRIAKHGGIVNSLWSKRLAGSLATSQLFTSSWPANPNCPLCSNR